MKIKTKVCALGLALALGCGVLIGCNPSNPNPSSAVVDTKYLVNVPTNADYTISGINAEGYLKDAKVSFTVTLTNTDKEITAVGYDTTTLTATASGAYEFNMPEKNVTLFVSTKNIERYVLSHSGAIQVDGDPVTFVLKLGTDPVSEDFTLEAVEGADKVEISGVTVTGKQEGQAVIAAKIGGVEKARETITVERSAYVTIAEAINDAWTNKSGFNDNSKSTTSDGKYKMRAKVVFMGNVYSGKVEMLIDDGTGILDYQITSSTNITAFSVGDVIEIEEKVQNYYGLMEAFSSDVKYAKKLDGVSINATAYTTIADGAAYDAVYNANMINDGQHKVVPVILQAKAKTVGEGADAKKRYEVQGATKGLLATSKSVIDLAFQEGATYNFKGFLMNWNSSASAQYCNFVAIEQTKLAATSVAIDQEDFSIALNTTKQLSYTTVPFGAGQSVAWSSNPAGKVTIDENGLLTAAAIGQTVVKLTVDGLEDTINVNVVEPIAATSAAFTPNTAEITNAETLDLQALLTSEPENNSDEFIKTWSVEPADAGTVEKGVFKPAKVGQAVVTAKYNDQVSASITITVRQQKISDLAHAKVDDPVDVYGYVTGFYPVANKFGLWIADGASGIYLNHAPKEGMVKDAIVHVVGKIAAYNGSKQIAATAYDVVESHEGLAAPTTLNLDEAAITALDETQQGRLATVTGVVKTHANQGQAGEAHHTLTLNVGEKTMKVYVHKDNCGATVATDFDRAVVGKQVSVTGFVTANKYNEKDFTNVELTDYQLINPVLNDVSDVQATGIVLDKQTADVRQGETLQLVVSANPEGAQLPGEVQWTVTGNEKVSVSNAGLVTVDADAVVDSTATVKATCGTFEATCVITVKGSGASIAKTLELDYAAMLAGGITTTAGAQTFTKDGLTITISRGTANATNSDVRVYASETITFSAKSITRIAFTCNGSGYNTTKFAEAEGLDRDAGVWTGSATEVTFTASSQVRIFTLTVNFVA